MVRGPLVFLKVNAEDSPSRVARPIEVPRSKVSETVNRSCDMGPFFLMRVAVSMLSESAESALTERAERAERAEGAERAEQC